MFQQPLNSPLNALQGYGFPIGLPRRCAPRNDGESAEPDGKRPDIPSRPKIRLLAGPSNDGRGAEPDGKRLKQPSPFEPHFLGGVQGAMVASERFPSGTAPLQSDAAAA